MSWREDGAAAVAQLDHVLAERPGRLHAEMSEALRSVVRLRDGLIAELRAGTASPDQRRRLQEVNSIVSVVCGAEFPLVGIRLERVRKARDALQALLGAG
jgi:hypothetical protein